SAWPEIEYPPPRRADCPGPCSAEEGACTPSWTGRRPDYPGTAWSPPRRRRTQLLQGHLSAGTKGQVTRSNAWLSSCAQKYALRLSTSPKRGNREFIGPE